MLRRMISSILCILDPADGSALVPLPAFPAALTGFWKNSGAVSLIAVQSGDPSRFQRSGSVPFGFRELCLQSGDLLFQRAPLFGGSLQLVQLT